MRKIVISSLLTASLLVSLTACKESEEYKLKAVAPQGAPAVALANLAVSDKDSFAFINADNISEEFTNESYDIVIAPINAGAANYKNGKSKYKIGAVVTWCNLYFATNRNDINDINDLDGKDVTLFGEKTINSSLAKYVLTNNNVTPNYNYVSSASVSNQKLIDEDNVIVMTAEPALTVAKAKAKDKTIKTFSIYDMYKTISGGVEYTQAALFIKEDTINNHKKELDSFLDKVKEACDLVSTDVETTANNIIELGNTGLPGQLPVLKNALPNCKVKYVSAIESKTAIEATVSIDPSKFGGAVPSDDFYYSK